MDHLFEVSVDTPDPLDLSILSSLYEQSKIDEAVCQ